MSVNRNVVIGTGVGFILGLSLSYLFINTQMFTYNAVFLNDLQSRWSSYGDNNEKRQSEGTDSQPSTNLQYVNYPTTDAPFHSKDDMHRNPHDPRSHADLENATGPLVDVVFHSPEEDAHKDEGLVAEELSKKVRVLCWIMTGPQNHQAKARHVKATWGKRCNKLIFMSSEEDPTLPAIKLDVQEGRDNLWGKTKQAFEYVYKHHLDDADWFVKADDDTYMIIENLRYLLKNQNSSTPIFFGHKFKPYVNQGYFSGGAGYVLSKEAVIRFVETGIYNSSICRQDNDGAEDVEMGKCMENLHVTAGDSRDTYGRKRFFPFIPEHHLIPGLIGKDTWYYKYIFYPEEEGMACCSDHTISFHYVSPNMMYLLEYLIYHLRPYGINMNSYPEDFQITMDK